MKLFDLAMRKIRRERRVEDVRRISLRVHFVLYTGELVL